MNNNMETIKVGDKVRVREDAPRIFFNRSICYYPDYIFEVREVEDGNADIYFGAGKIPLAAFVLPTKYLVKVEDVAKEAKPKYKVGDRVRIISLHGRPIPDGNVDVIAHINIGNEKQMYFLENHYGCAYGFSESDLEPYTEPTEEKIKVGSEYWGGKTVWNCKSHTKGFIKRIFDGAAEVLTEYGENKLWPLMDLVDEYDDPFEKWKPVQPTEQTEAEKKPNVGSITIPVKVDLDETFWDSYAADLAREIALKVANKYGDPKEAGEYVVKVVEVVVAGLKRK